MAEQIYFNEYSISHIVNSLQHNLVTTPAPKPVFYFIYFDALLLPCYGFLSSQAYIWLPFLFVEALLISSLLTWPHLCKTVKRVFKNLWNFFFIVLSTLSELFCICYVLSFIFVEEGYSYWNPMFGARPHKLLVRLSLTALQSPWCSHRFFSWTFRHHLCQPLFPLHSFLFLTANWLLPLSL